MKKPFRRSVLAKPLHLVLWPAIGLTLFVAGTQAGLRAAGAKPLVEASFGPDDVAASDPARFVLSLRNAGTADATLAAGDRIDVRFGTGALATDLTTDAAPLTAVVLPTGLVEQPLMVDADRVGTTYRAQGAVTIAPGASLVVEMTATAGPPGIAPVVIDLALAKTAGKVAKRTEFRVVKSRTPADLFFGDGADGDLVVASDTALEPLRSYANVRIPAGVTVTVPSGTTIRCTGDFENRGTIVVGPGGAGGGGLLDDAGGPGTYDITNEVEPAAVEIGAGDAPSAPARPRVVFKQAVSGARGGRGHGDRVQALPLSHWRQGGGGGSGALGAVGGSGGGVLRILARGEVRNGGTIVAAGQASVTNRTGAGVGGGGGGGGGGVVLLASGFRVTNDVPANAGGTAATGTIDVRGGNGGPPDFFGGQGGPGGGGLVLLVADDVGAFGNTLLTQGAAFVDMVDLPPEASFWSGGGGGGASAGDGGDGAGVTAAGKINQLATTPAPATAGRLVVRTSDPRTLW